MANRIYIAVGLIAILLLAGAFLVPRVIDWNVYKPRMEAMTAEALGIEVAIEGDMSFVLLPQPRMRIHDVRIGPADHPLGEVHTVEADFSLMDFLRDRFTVTRLVLAEPQLNLTIDETGHLETPITLAETATASNVSIANARFENGTVRLSDMRGGETWAATQVTGDLRMSALRGPFAMQGQASYGGATYLVRMGTSPLNPEGGMQLAAFLRPAAGGFSVSADGIVQTGAAPRFEGTLTYRQRPQPGSDAVVGDMLLESPLIVDLDQILLSEFTLLPDENQSTARLTGAASVSLGDEPQFDATVSGGSIILVPRAVNETANSQPFDLVRLLSQMPEPLIPPLPGHLNLSINELGLRGIGLREVRLDAVSDGQLWRVDELSGRLAGDTTVKLTGTLGRAAGWPAFEGTLAVAARRLDSLSLLWKRPEEGNPLFNMPGSLNGNIRLSSDSLRLSNGIATIDNTAHQLSGLLRFGDQPRLEADARLSALSSGQSAALLALLPPIDPAGTFGLSFPEGRLDLIAEAGSVAGQRFSDLSLALNWAGQAIGVEGLRVGDFGGVAFEGSGRVRGTLAQPEISGSGHLGVLRNAQALDLLLGGEGNHPLRRAVLGSLPAELDIRLDPVGSDGVQALALEGQAGVADLNMVLYAEGGMASLGQGQLEVSLDAAADSGADLLRQFGLAPVIAGEDGALLTLTARGHPLGSMETGISFEGGGERVDFNGTLLLSNWAEIRGEGTLAFLFEDTGEVMALAGAEGVYFPAVSGITDLVFTGPQSVSLLGLFAYAGEREVRGDLTYAAQSNAALVSGNLTFDVLDIETLATMLGGRAATLGLTSGVWPDGPLDVGQVPRTTRGRIGITAPVLAMDGEPVVEALAFDYAWDNEEVRLRGLMGEFGGGTVQLEAALCCANQLADKNLAGRFTLNGVTLDALLPDVPADVIRGRLTAGGQFQGNGDSFRTLIGSLGGDGSFLVENLAVARLSPTVFDAASSIGNIIELEPEALELLVVTALDSGDFMADEAGGLFTIAAGSVRAANIAIDGRGARLLGGGTVRLADLALTSNWTLALTRTLLGNRLITETTGRIGVILSGSLFAPERQLDLSQMVDAIQMRAYEIELEELERLRAEQEARQRALAEEQARMMEEEARRQAEELLRREQEEAERLQQEEQRRRLQEIQNQLSAPPPQNPPASGPSTPQSGPAVPPRPLVVPNPNAPVFDLPQGVTQF